MAIQLVAFDFDGTLVDTAPDIIRATNEFLQLHGRDPLSSEEITTHIGSGLLGLIRGVVPEAEHHPEIITEIETQFSRVYDEYVLNQPELFDGVLDFLKGWPHALAIVSNKPERYIHQLLPRLGLDQFPWAAIIGGDTLAKCKPHPMALQAAMTAAGTTAKETLMVGDGPPDVEVALACGSQFIAVSYGYSPLAELKALGARHWLSDFSDLAPHIAQLNSLPE